MVLFNPVEVIRHPNGLEYATVVTHPMVWAVAYIVAVIGPPLLSGYRSIVAFGALNLIGLVTVAIFYAQAFASLWCIFAAVSSVLILIHMIRRRATPGADRLPGSPGPCRSEPVTDARRPAGITRPGVAPDDPEISLCGP